MKKILGAMIVFIILITFIGCSIFNKNEQVIMQDPSVKTSQKTADLLKVFIASHNDSHKLRKAIFNINLFQSLIAAHFFKMQKKYELFLKMIISYLNNCFFIVVFVVIVCNSA